MINTWKRLDGPYPSCVAGDNEYEVSSFYARGNERLEITYYVEGPADLGEDPRNGSWGVMCAMCDFTVNDEGEANDDDDYDYDYGSPYCYWSLESAIAECDRLASEDEAWKFNYGLTGEPECGKVIT